MKNFTYILTLMIFISGCSMKVHQTPLILKAKKDYESIKDDKNIKNNAPKSLLQATKLYNLLDNADDERRAEHLAYLLRSEVNVAKESAKIAKLKEEISNIDKQKNRALELKKQEELEKRSPKILQDLNPVETQKGLVLTLGDELFEKKKSGLLIWSIGKIENLAKFLKNNPDRKIFIAGFSDDFGTASHNLDFSIRRADAVAKVLTASGIERSRIVIKGYGEEHPIASNETDEGRTQNRRVEIIILNEGENVDDLLNY